MFLKKIYYKHIIIFLLIGILLVYLLSIIKEPFDANSTQIKTYEIPFHIKRKINRGHTEINGVPLVIYQSWHSNMVPEKMRDTIYDVVHKNPEFDYYLYSDERCAKFIEENFDKSVVDAFYSLKPGAYKSDLWRYCILYKRGGVYLDIKFTTLKPLLHMIEKNPTLYVNDRPNTCTNTKEYSHGLYNGFMISPANNAVLKYCIDDIVNSCKLKLYKNRDIEITGPCLLGEMVEKHSPNIKREHSYNENDKKQALIFNNAELVCIGYKEYREEQKHSQKSKHYAVAWNERDVYN